MFVLIYKQLKFFFTQCKKLKLDLSDKKTYIDAPSSSQLLDDDDLPGMFAVAIQNRIIFKKRAKALCDWVRI